MKRRLALLTGVVLACVLVAAAVLLGTQAGARWLFGQLAARVPGLDAAAVDGSLAGTVRLTDLAWTDGRNRLHAAQVELALAPTDLLFAPRRIDRIAARGVVLALGAAPSDEPPTDAATPGDLPALAIGALGLQDARVVWPSGRETFVEASGALALSGRRITLDAASVRVDDWTLAGAATLDLDRAQFLAAARIEVARATAPAIAATLDVTERAHTSAVVLVVRDALQARAEGDVAHDLARATVRVVLPRQDIEAVALASEVAAELTLDWDGERLRPRGRLSRGADEIAVHDGSLRPDASAVRVEGLALDWTGHGAVQADGVLPLADTGSWDLALRTEGLALPRDGAPPLQVRGQLQMSGPRSTPRLVPALSLDAPGFPTASISGAVQVDAEGLRLESLALTTDGGVLSLDGVVGAVDGDEVALRARGLDPARFLPGWPGALDADLEWRGRLRDGPATGTLELQRLDGTLRGRALSGTGRLQFDDGVPGASTLQLAAGRARFSATLEAGARTGTARLDVPDLGDLAPGVAGRLEADWTRDAGDRLVARVDGLRAGGWRLLRGEVDLTLPRAADAALSGHVELESIERGALALRRVRATLDGTRAAHRVRLDAAHAEGALQARLEGRYADDGWRGTLAEVDANSGRLRIALREPAPLAWGAEGLRLAPACLDAAGGAACLDAEGTAASGRAGLLLDGWSLAALRPVWPALPELEGLVEGEVQLAWRDGAWVSGDLRVQSARGLARLPERPDLDLGYRGLALTGQWTPDGGRIDGGADLIPDGRIDLAATLTPGTDGVPGIDATLDLVVRQLDGIEAFTTMIADPEGEIRGQLRLQGGALPRSISGALALTGFTAQVPSRAIRVRDGVLVLAGVPGQLLVRGSVVSGDGTLTLDGRIDTGDPVPTLLRLGGKDFRFSNTPTLSLVATPDLTLAHRDGRWQLDGRLDIPRARVDASKLEGGVDRSPDVVVADAEQPGEPPRPWRARVKVVLGDDVRLEGFGFDGTLAGELDISQRQGAQAVANGEITLRGRYQAYGQRLQIERGGLRYANSPLAEPTLDLRAERKVRDRTVALQITGNALRPESQIVAGQGLSDSEALALLVTGRPLNQAGADDRERLSDAASALGTVGSDLLTRNLRGRLGLDELGVSNDTGLDGEAFTLGKYLSPRLYVGYGIGLLTRGEVFTVRYLVTDRIELEASAGASTRAAVNWRLER